jgi:hypothetical protein
MSAKNKEGKKLDEKKICSCFRKRIKRLKKDELTLPEIFCSGCFCSVVSSVLFSGLSFPVFPMQMFRDKK